MWLSRLTRTQGQFSRAAICSTWVDLPVPWKPWIMTRRLCLNPARMASVVSLSNRYAGSVGGTRSVDSEKAGTSMSLSIPKAWRTETIMSGAPDGRLGRSS